MSRHLNRATADQRPLAHALPAAPRGLLCRNRNQNKQSIATTSTARRKQSAMMDAQQRLQSNECMHQVARRKPTTSRAVRECQKAMNKCTKAVCECDSEKHQGWQKQADFDLSPPDRSGSRAAAQHRPRDPERRQDLIVRVCVHTKERDSRVRRDSQHIRSIKSTVERKRSSEVAREKRDLIVRVCVSTIRSNHKLSQAEHGSRTEGNERAGQQGEERKRERENGSCYATHGPA